MRLCLGPQSKDLDKGCFVPAGCWYVYCVPAELPWPCPPAPPTWPRPHTPAARVTHCSSAGHPGGKKSSERNEENSSQRTLEPCACGCVHEEAGLTWCQVSAPPWSRASRQVRAALRMAAGTRPACHTRLGSRRSSRKGSRCSENCLRVRRQGVVGVAVKHVSPGRGPRKHHAGPTDSYH